MKKHLTLFVCLLLFMICGGAGFAQSKAVTMEFGGKKYEIQLSDTSAAEYFLSLLPLKNETMNKFGGFEYYTNIQFKISSSDKRTKMYRAGHIYYNIHYSAISLVFDDHDISPSEAVEIGTFTDKEMIKTVSAGKSRENVSFVE